MTNAATETAPRGPRGLVARLQERGRDEGGFVLLETMIALTLITVIMAAVSVEYVNGVIVSAQQRSAATASQLASSAMADLRSYNATDLVTGRSQSAVLTQRERLLKIDRVKQWVSGNGNVTAYSAGTQEVVPTSPQETIVSGRTFRLDRYLECTKDATAGACASAGNLTRLIVAVVWNERGCPASGCAFVSTTLVDTHADPTFDINQPLPTAPVLLNPGDQVVTVGDKIGDKPGDTFPAVRFVVEDGTGAAPFSWKITGALPAGLTYSPDGGVSGVPAGPASDTPVSTIVTVTDAFQREASATVQWTVRPSLELAPVSPPVTFEKRPIAELQLRATGGAGGNVFGATNLPPGLTLDTATGNITGTPAAAGSYVVTATVTDRTGKRRATTTFTWKVDYPPLGVAQPPNETSTRGQADSMQILADGGSGSYTYSATNLPAGLSMNATSGVISGTPSNVTTARQVDVTVTDQKAVDANGNKFFAKASLTWQVVERPTVTSPGNRTNSRGATVDVAVSAQCPNVPCTYSISGQPSGLTINGSTGRIVGTVADSATTSSNVVVTVRDAAGATSSTSAFTWTVVAAPTIANPANQAGTRSRPDSLSTSSTCGHGTCTFSASGLPSGLTVNSATGAVGGTIASNATTSTTARITITDASGVSRTTNAFTWTVNAPPSWGTLNNRSSTRSQSVGSISFAGSVSGGTPSLTYSANRLPAGLTLNSSTGVVTGTPSTAGSTSVTLTVTDSHGAAATSNSFTWTVNNP